MRVVDHDGIDVWEIDAGLNNATADQQREISFRKGEHCTFQFPGLHLSVGDTDPYVRQQLLQFGHDARYAFDFVVNEEHLTATLKLLVNGPSNQVTFEIMDGQTEMILRALHILIEQEKDRFHINQNIHHIDGTNNLNCRM